MADILVVDDSATQAEMVAAILEGAGYVPVIAHDGETALALFETAHFDAVISDIVMPGISGYELCRQIKAMPQGAHVPIILLSTLNEAMDIIKGLECGADNFLTKPCPSDVLLARLHSILQNMALRVGRRAKLGVEIVFLGQRFTIDSDREQILDLLISTFEATVRANRELQHNRAELAEAKARVEQYAATLEDKVRERTKELVDANAKIAAEIEVRRQTEAELRDARAFLDLVIENMPASIMVKEAETLNFVLVNAAAEESTGLTRDELIGKNSYGVLPYDLADHVADRDRRALRAGGVINIPEQIMQRAGRPPRHVRTRLAPVADNDGKPKYLIIISENVTELRNVEQQLRQSQKLEAIGQLTGGIAHDFNNLLGIMLGNLDLLTEQISAESDQMELVEEAIGAARRGAELTQRMLAFARKQPLHPRTFDMNKIVTGMESMLRRTLGEDIELLVAPADNLWTVIADPSQVEDVLINLAVNARDAMPRGGHLVIETAAVRLDESYSMHNAEVVPGDYVMVAVTDSGSGIPPEILDRIFEPFFTTKEAGRGTGLGLSMAYGFAKQSGGHLKIYSEIGHGTTVKIYLPRAAGSTLVEERDKGEKVLPPGRETVCLVEDNDALRRTTVRMLKELGYVVLEAPHGPAAIELLEKSGDVDLLLTDIVMPKGMSGYDLAELVQAKRPTLKVLFMSGYSATFINQLDIARPQAHFISKPCRKRDLAIMLRTVLDDTE
jgi:PAS domain S-box-containing protein